MLQIHPAVLETSRLVLRPFREEDAPMMYRSWASDPEVTRFLTWPTHDSEDVTRAVLRHWISTGAAEWCIALRQTDAPIGSMGVVDIDEGSGTVEVGYCLSRACWGQGYAAEALRAVIGHLFALPGVRRVTAKHDLNNPNSGRVMQKAGMVWLENRSGFVNNTGVCDVAVYGVDRPLSHA